MSGHADGFEIVLSKLQHHAKPPSRYILVDRHHYVARRWADDNIIETLTAGGAHSGVTMPLALFVARLTQVLW